MSITTMILFKGGNEVDRIIGVVPEEAARDFISK
jgi:thioredoxin-like negative regulator of GroEL